MITFKSSFRQSEMSDRNTSPTVDGGRAFFLNPPSKHNIRLNGNLSGNNFDHQQENNFRRSSSLFFANSRTFICRSLLNAPITEVGVAE